jgi:hypothetical protein
MIYKLVIIAHNNVFVVHVFLTGARGNLHVSTLYGYILIIISIYSCNLMLKSDSVYDFIRFYKSDFFLPNLNRCEEKFI